MKDLALKEIMRDRFVWLWLIGIAVTAKLLPNTYLGLYLEYVYMVGVVWMVVRSIVVGIRKATA